MLKAELKDGNIVLTMPFDKKGISSASGKSTVHASTRGNQTVSVKDGKSTLFLSAGVNVYSKK
jgi:hypothetical protein